MLEMKLKIRFGHLEHKLLFLRCVCCFVASGTSDYLTLHVRKELFLYNKLLRKRLSMPESSSLLCHSNDSKRTIDLLILSIKVCNKSQTEMKHFIVFLNEINCEKHEIKLKNFVLTSAIGCQEVNCK